MFKWKGFLTACLLLSSPVFASDAYIVRFDLTDSVKTFYCPPGREA